MAENTCRILKSTGDQGQKRYEMNSETQAVNSVQMYNYIECLSFSLINNLDYNLRNHDSGSRVDRKFKRKKDCYCLNYHENLTNLTYFIDIYNRYSIKHFALP